MFGENCPCGGTGVFCILFNFCKGSLNVSLNRVSRMGVVRGFFYNIWALRYYWWFTFESLIFPAPPILFSSSIQGSFVRRIYSKPWCTSNSPPLKDCEISRAISHKIIWRYAVLWTQKGSTVNWLGAMWESNHSQWSLTSYWAWWAAPRQATGATVGLQIGLLDACVKKLTHFSREKCSDGHWFK